MFRYYYDNDTGMLLQRRQHHQVTTLPTDGDWVDDALRRNINQWRYVDGEFVEYTLPTPTRPVAYDQARRNNFGTAEQQMALLYDDIKAGKFGEDAKTGLWYLHVKAVKDANPKD